jgi:glyoxylase-like metal-dependent hydrolase (beta-lactamase superfamily II)
MGATQHTIGQEFYMIRSKEKDFHRNIFLKKFVSQDGRSVNMVFDPGTSLDMPDILQLLKTHIGGMSNVNLVFLSHQDPDLTANIGTVLKLAPRSYLITSVDTWRLVKMYGLPEKRVRTVESFDSHVLRMKKSGHRVRFVPARYCHFRGAMMVYDYESRVLFTGDFMGGVTTRQGDGIYATEDSWEGIKLFHQLYMPSTKAVMQTIERISTLNPFPEVIAPQHGDIIKGDLVVEFLDRMSRLQVGVDLVEDNNPEVDIVVLALNNFLELLEINFPDIKNFFIDKFQKGNNFTSPFIFQSGTISGIKISPDNALLQVFAMIGAVDDPEIRQHLKAMFLDTLDQLHIKFTVATDEPDNELEVNSEDSFNLDDMLE